MKMLWGKTGRVLGMAILVVLLGVVFCAAASAASGDVAGAVQNTWDAAKEQIKAVVNNVVFPAIDLILAVLFFVKIGMSYMEYRKHGQFELTAPAILFACLVFMLTCPLYIWTILGM